MYSSNRAPRLANGTPAASYSSRSQPMPRPTVSRPPDSTSREAVALARRAGGTNGAQTVAVPSPIRRVQAAANARVTTGSSTARWAGSSSLPTGCSTRWKAHRWAYPRSSARRATCATASGVAQGPATGRPNPRAGRSATTGQLPARIALVGVPTPLLQSSQWRAHGGPQSWPKRRASRSGQARWWIPSHLGVRRVGPGERPGRLPTGGRDPPDVPGRDGVVTSRRQTTWL